jgi:hypothetical protein
MSLMMQDLVVFLFISFIFSAVKQLDPNKFYLPYGIRVFLPPDEKDLIELRKEKEKDAKSSSKGQKLKPNAVNLYL